MEQELVRLKYVFREDGGQYRPALYTDGELCAAVPGVEAALAEHFLQSFVPKALRTRMFAACGASLVMVMRTSDVQMREFGDLLGTHGGAVL